MLDDLLNVITIVAWVFFLLFLAFTALRGFQEGGTTGALKAFAKNRVIGAFFLVVFITFLSAALVFIEPQEVGVVISIISQDGYREQPFRSGLHWIVPLAEKLVRYPIYWQTYTMSNDPLEGDKIGDDSIAARTSDGQAVYLDSTVIYRLNGNEAIRVHIDLQDRYVQDFIRPVLRGIIRTEVSQFTADEVNSSKRKILESNLDELTREAFSEKGFLLDRFLLRNIAFSPQYATAIEQKQVAEQERKQKEYQAEQIRRLAEGVSDKYRIEAEGRADATVLEGQAAAEVILLKAQAEAKALELINEVLEKNKDLITFRYVDKLGPGIKVMLVPNDNPYLLPLPDLSADLSIETSELMQPPFTGVTETVTSTLTITPTITLTPTLELAPTVSPTPVP